MDKKAEELFNWQSNPFSFKILPEFFVGYENEFNLMRNGLGNGDKFSLVLGPTGSGKTTFLKHLLGNMNGHRVIYLPKPPKDPEEWLTVFRDVTKPKFRIFRKNDDITLYNISEKMNERLDGKKCILFVDECHEASIDSLEWLRTIADQTDNLSVVLAGLPVFENILKSNLESLQKRFSINIKLSNLTKSEVRELIKRRIEGIGGDDIKPFTSEALDYIYGKTGGFPREVLKECDSLAGHALSKGLSTIDRDLLSESEETPRISLETLGELPERQKKVMDVLAKETLTPSEIVSRINIEEYKNKDNALRSVNNILRRLMSDNLVERKRVGKTYKYKVSGKFESLTVTA